MNGPSVTMPIKPITTEGIAARSSMPAFSTSFVLRGAISAMNSALAIPIGIEIIPAPAVTKIDPTISGKISRIAAGQRSDTNCAQNKKSDIGTLQKIEKSFFQQECKDQRDNDNRHNAAEENHPLNEELFYFPYQHYVVTYSVQHVLRDKI